MASDAYSTAILALSPTAYYRLDEASGTVCNDSSGNAHTLVYGASVTLNQTGLIPAVSTNAAIKMSVVGTGTAAYTVTSSAQIAALQAGTALTVAFWFKPTAVTSGWNNVLLAYGQDSTTPYAGYNLNYTATTTLLGFNCNSGGNFMSMTGTTSLVAGKTYFYVCVFNNTDMRMYLNGALEGTPLAATGTITYPSTGGLCIGGDPAHVDRGANAVMDEVAIWAGTALSATQISALYTAGTVVAASNIPYQPNFALGAILAQ